MLQSRNDYQKQQIRATGDLVAAVETRLRGASASGAAHLRELRDVYVQRESILRGALTATQPLERLLTRWRADFAAEGGERPLAERAVGACIATRALASRIWNFEFAGAAPDFDPAKVATDLRELIVRRPAAAGKAIPFPQRAFHLDEPLRVKIGRPPQVSGNAAGSPA